MQKDSQTKKNNPQINGSFYIFGTDSIIKESKMGFISAGITVMIGYFAIEFLKKNKETLKDLPVISGS